MAQKCTLCCACFALLIVGGLNWGLVGVAQFNLVNAIFGSWPVVERLIYVLVGAAAVMALIGMAKGGKCPACEKASGASGG